MANRLTNIYTRTGDTGTTGMANGSRIAKDDILMHVQGDIDELNSALGLLATKLLDEQLQHITHIQHVLFDIGGELSLGQALVQSDKVEMLEQHIDAFNKTLQPLKEFILPGGNEKGALCHMARTICRRAERNMVTLKNTRDLNPVSLQYINRLSDFLFVFARVLNDKDEIYWNRSRQ